MKAVVIEKIRKSYYNMEYVQIHRHTFTGDNTEAILREIYSYYGNFFDTDSIIEIEFN